MESPFFEYAQEIRELTRRRDDLFDALQRLLIANEKFQASRPGNRAIQLIAQE